MKITIQFDNQHPEDYDLEQFGKDVISFGRQPDNDIVLNYDFISRVHGVFYKDNGKWFVEDLDSTNGLYMNACRIKREELKPDSVFLITGEHSGDRVGIYVAQQNMQEAIEKDTIKLSKTKGFSAYKIAEWVFAIILILVIIIGIVIPKYMIHKYDKNELLELFVGTTMQVEDNNRHVVTFKVTTPEQIKIIEQEEIKQIGIFQYKCSLVVNVDIGTGILKDALVDIEVPFFGNGREVKWYYKGNENAEYDDPQVLSDIKFNYTKEPAVTVGDIMNHLGVSGSYQIMGVDATCVSSNYDAVEFGVIYRKIGVGDTETRQDWVRLEYDYSSGEWEWCQPVEKDKKTSLYMAIVQTNLEKGGFEADTKYTEDYVVTFAPMLTDVEE